MTASPSEVEARQFGVHTDGTVRGDDGAGGRLAASLRYAARLAGQVEYLLDVGDLLELATVSREALTARITRDDAGGVGLSARVDRQPYRQPKVLTVVGGADVHAALAHCVQRVQQTPGVRWGAIIADDKRVVGASLPQAGAAVLESVSALPNVGVRALAVLGAIEEPLRESWVQLTYERAIVLVASVGPHCLYAVVDDVKGVPFGETVDEVRAILAPYDLSEAATLATESVDSIADIEVEPAVAAAVPAPTGMRYRAVRPRAAKENKRGLFGR
jgi:hypothetical protein